MAGELPVTINLEAYQGDSWFQTFRLKEDTVPLDLNGATVKSDCHGTGTLFFQIPVQIDDPNDGRITMFLPTGISAGSYRYDLQVSKAGVITTWVTGKLDVSREVTT